MILARRALVLPLLAGGVLVAAELAAMRPACAQTRSLYSLSVAAETEHDSNPMMVVGDAAGTTWLRVRPAFSARHVLGVEEYRFDAALAAARSSNPEVAKDRLDPRLRGLWKRSDEVGSSEIAVLLERRSLRSLDVVEQVASGRDGTKTLLSVGGNWSREVSERNTASADIRQDWERHTGGVGPDFRRTIAAARLTRQQTELRNWYLAVNGQAFQTAGSGDTDAGARDGGRTVVAGALVGVNQQFSPTFRVDANAGVLRFVRPRARSDWQSAVRAEYTTERWLLGLEYSRASGVSPSFEGLVVAEAIALHARRDLSETTRLELDARWARDKGTPNERQIAVLSLVHQLSEFWELSLRASRIQHRNGAGTARAHQFALLLVYSIPDL